MEPYPIPTDGPVGRLLLANGRNGMRPAHIHVMASHPGYQALVTHVFDAASAHLQDDAVFGVRASLVRAFTNDSAGELAATFDISLLPHR